jgi:GNAT superfamily N-acetyltransferase
VTVRVRAAERGDLDELLALLSQLHEDEPPHLATAELAACYESILATPGRTILVAVRDGDGEGEGLLGTLDISVSENLTHGGRPWADLEKVVVDRDHRRAGVGAALLDAAMALAREADCYKVQLLSRGERGDAHTFYEAQGFEGSARGFRRYFGPPR